MFRARRCSAALPRAARWLLCLGPFRKGNFFSFVWQGSTMPNMTGTGPTGRLSSSTSRVRKVKQSPSRGTARRSSSTSTAASTSCHNWPKFANEVSSASSDHDGLGIRLIPARPSSNEDCCLACPYAKLKCLLAEQMAGQNGGTYGKRCWSKSYPNISRLKYANPLRKFLLITCPADDLPVRAQATLVSLPLPARIHMSQMPEGILDRRSS